MKPDSRDALTLALNRGIAKPESKGSWPFYNAAPLPHVDVDWKHALVCEQQFRPVYLVLKSEGYNVSQALGEIEGVNNGAILLLGRNRLWNQHQIIRAWNQMPPGGRLIIGGNKTDGIGATRKWFSQQTEIGDSMSKHHAIVFWADKSTQTNLPSVENLKKSEGYLLSEGGFSSAGPDKGSRLLVEHFDNRISGKVADLGAGWGFLSRELLEKSDRIDLVDLFEADFSSLQLAEQNIGKVPGREISFHWCDITSEFSKKPYDWVVMNPPFHSGRAANPQLGKQFIEVAASTLPRGGKLLMVANRNLPYEQTLEKNFRRFEKLSEQDGFKVIEATR
ncbi:MAG: class I SAM-dependent methyltransferase [Rhizobiaceae bacterium]